MFITDLSIRRPVVSAVFSIILVVFGLFVLSIILEVLHAIIPNRAFQIGDLLGNILGVLLAYFLVKIYELLSKT